MNVELTEELLDRYKGGQIEVQNQLGGYLYHGGIEEIVLNGGVILEIQLAWKAVAQGYPPLAKSWERAEPTVYQAILMPGAVSDIGNDRLHFVSPTSADIVVLFLPGAARFDPSEVEGLLVQDSP